MYERTKQLVKKLVPDEFIKRNEDLIRKSLSVLYRGNKFSCNICGFRMSKFVTLNNGDSLCPHCGTLARTRRLFSLIIAADAIESEDDQRKILHFSPPKAFAKKLKSTFGDKYTTTDYVGEFNADKKLDITNIEEADNSYQLIICYHVLEHIEEDELAMKELYRILDKGGMCFIQTPFKEGEIYEDSAIKTEEDRLKHFGQEDHVRIYSVQGLKKRLTAAGFNVKVLTFSEKEDNHYGFNANEVVLVGKKE